MARSRLPAGCIRDGIWARMIDPWVLERQVTESQLTATHGPPPPRMQLVIDEQGTEMIMGKANKTAPGSEDGGAFSSPYP